jgi:integrase
MNARSSVRGFLTYWLENVRAKRKAKTHKCYSDTVRLYVPASFQDLELGLVTPLDVEEVITALSSKSPRIRQLTHAVLRSAFKSAVSWRLIPSNPVEGVEAPKVPKTEMSTWSADELRRFLAYVKGDRFELLFRLAAETGWREGELLALRWSDFNFTSGTVTCSRTLTEIDGRLSFGEPKTEAGKRTVSLSAEMLKFINGTLFVELYVEPDWLVFRTRENTPVSMANFFKHFQKRVKEAGVKRIRFHDIRHTNATLSLINGVDPRTLAGRLGHSDVRTTLSIYGKFTREGDKKAADLLGSIISGNGENK